MPITSTTIRADKRLKMEQQDDTKLYNKNAKPYLEKAFVNSRISLHNEFTKANLKVGRDTLFNILRKHHMLTLRKKPTYKTTNSMHRFYKYKNIIKDLSK